MDERLDLRRDLGAPPRAIAAVSRLADGLAFRPLHSESAADIDDGSTREVAPALAEIEDGFAEHGLVRDARTLGADLKALSVKVRRSTSDSEPRHRSMAGSHRQRPFARPVAEAAGRAATSSRAARRELKGRERCSTSARSTGARGRRRLRSATETWPYSSSTTSITAPARPATWTKAMTLLAYSARLVRIRSPGLKDSA